MPAIHNRRKTAARSFLSFTPQIIVLMCLFIFNTSVSAQSQGKALYDSGHDAFKDRDYKKAEENWRLSYQAYQKEGNHEKEVECLGLIAKGLMHQFKVPEAKVYYLKMKDQAKKYGHQTKYLESCNAIATMLKFQGKIDSTLLIQRHILSFETLPHTIESDALTTIAEVITDTDSVKLLLSKAIQIDSTHNDSSSIAFNYLCYSRALKTTGEHNEAIQKLLRGITYLRKDKDEFKLTNFYIELGYMFYEIHNYAKAKEYGQKALDQASKFKSKSGSADAYLLLGNAYSAENGLTKAKEYYEKASEISKKIKRQSSLSQLNTINVLLALRAKDYDLAKNHLDKLKDRISGEEKSGSYVRYLQAKAQYEIATNSKNAIKTIRAYDKATASKSNLQYYKTKELLYQSYYRKNNDFKNALFHSDAYHQYLDSLKNKQLVYKLQDTEAKYQQKEQKAEIARLNAENEVKVLRLNKQRRFLFGTLTGLALLSLFIFFLYRLYSKLKEKNIIIKQALHEKEILIKEVHHRVKNNLQVISALLSLQSKHIKDESAIEALRKGNARVESMALIHKDLYQHDNLKGVNARDYFDQLIESLFHSYKIGDDDITLTQEVEDLWLDVDTMIPLGLMMNEFISNALKHAFTEQNHGKIHLSLKEKNQSLILNIFDNGKGVSNLEDMKNKSFGYSLIQSFARKLKADVAYKHDNGLNVELTIKKYKKAS